MSLLFLILFLIFWSAFFSASDMAISSVNKVRLRRYAEEKQPGALKAMELVKEFNRSISSILIWGNIVDILNTAVVTAVLSHAFGPIGALYATALMTVIIVLFGEILPKALVKNHAERFLLASAGLLTVLNALVSPLLWAINLLTNKVSTMGHHSIEPGVTHDELLTIVGDMSEEGTLPRAEAELISNAVNFNELQVWEVQTPRIDLFALNVDEKIERAQRLILSNHYTRVPLYEGTTDNIVGILNEKVFLEKLCRGELTNLRSCMQKPLLVSGGTSLLDAFRILKTNRTHMAVVLDDYGGTSGIVTLEDLMEELLGEIYDELDDIKEYVTAIDEQTYVATGDVYLEDLFFKFLKSMVIPDTDAPTLNGWLIEQFKVFPEVGATLTWNQYEFQVIKVAGQRITRVRVICPPKEQINSEEGKEA